MRKLTKFGLAGLCLLSVVGSGCESGAEPELSGKVGSAYVSFFLEGMVGKRVMISKEDGTLIYWDKLEDGYVDKIKLIKKDGNEYEILKKDNKTIFDNASYQMRIAKNKLEMEKARAGMENNISELNKNPLPENYKKIRGIEFDWLKPGEE